MSKMLPLLLSAMVLCCLQAKAGNVVVFPAINVVIIETQNGGVGLALKDSSNALIEFEKQSRFYVQSALACALSLDTYIQIDKKQKKLYVGIDKQPVEKGWLIDARNIVKEDGALSFRKANRSFGLNGIQDFDWGSKVGMGGFITVKRSAQAAFSEGVNGEHETRLEKYEIGFIGFESFVLNPADKEAQYQPTLRLMGAEENRFRIVGKNLSLRVLPRTVRLGSFHAMPTVFPNGPETQFRALVEEAKVLEDPYRSWRFSSGTILLSQPDEKNDLGAALLRLRRNERGQGQVIIIPMKLNDKWAILRVMKDSQTLFVDWSGASTAEHLDEFLKHDNNLAPRILHKMRPPNFGEDDSAPMFEKLRELLNENPSPREVISPRLPLELLQQVAAIGLGVLPL